MKGGRHTVIGPLKRCSGRCPSKAGLRRAAPPQHDNDDHPRQMAIAAPPGAPLLGSGELIEKDVLLSRSILMGAQPITELVPIHVAAALYPISRLTELRVACQFALLLQRSALYRAAVEIGLSPAVSSEQWVQATGQGLGYFPSRWIRLFA
jgi:hypothetical protein